MADILIKDIELPRTLTIYPNGDIDELVEGKYVTIGKAIELPPHGRLGDLDLVEEWMRKKHKDNDCPFNIDAFLFALRKIPTVLEAST